MSVAGTERRRERLRELIERELASPRPFEEIAAELPDLLPGTGEWAEVLRLLAQADRSRFWVRAEAHWHQRFGWRLMRPLLLVALIGAAVAVLQRAFDPTAAFVLFLSGTAALYVALQLYIHRWAALSRRRLAEIEREFREALRERLARLGDDRPGPAPISRNG